MKPHIIILDCLEPWSGEALAGIEIPGGGWGWRGEGRGLYLTVYCHYKTCSDEVHVKVLFILCRKVSRRGESSRLRNQPNA